MRPYIAAVVLLASVSTAQADFVDGNFLHESCMSSSPFASGYVIGWVDKWQNDSTVVNQNFPFDPNADTSNTDLESRKILLRVFVNGNLCLPTNAVSGQIKDVVCKYLKENPAKRSNTGETVIGDALDQAFPCRK